MNANNMQNRMAKLEQQVADLTSLLRMNGYTIIKCAHCRKVMTHDIYITGPEDLLFLNGHGISGVSLRDEKYVTYYCPEHLSEAYEDCADWCERDKERAEYTIAAYLLKQGRYTFTPERTKAMMLFPVIKEKMEYLAELQREEAEKRKHGYRTGPKLF